MSSEKKYTPKTGSNAGKINFDRIKKYLDKNPGATGVEISRALRLSLPAVYGHLKNLR